MDEERKPARPYAFPQTTLSSSAWHFAAGWEKNFSAGAELLAFGAGEGNPLKLSGCLAGREQVNEGIRAMGGRRRKRAARGC